MNRKKRTLRKSIFIACEGQTEERYFGAIRDIVYENPTYSVNVRILEIEDGTPQHPIGLVTEAARISQEEGHDEAWAVFDKDREPNHETRIQAFQQASKLGVKIAYSSIAFEHWVLLHFEKNRTAFQRCDCETAAPGVCTCNGQVCVTSYLRANYLAGYKKGSYKLYSQISPHNQTAVENTAWLKFINRGLLSSGLSIISPYQLNPYSDVDLLLIQLLDMKKVKYSESNFPLTLNGKTFELRSTQQNSLMVRVTNSTGTAYIINNQGAFMTRDSTGQLHQATIANPVLIDPNQSREITFSCNIPNGQSLREFRVTENDNVLIFGI